MTVETVAGSGHNVFRDQHARFMDVVDRWLAALPAPAR
jgi:pimeloyl-ACP methyl ester carboxylesterase